ncbi:MAG: DUF222 domain-containing protein [Acidimicrobiia bacterium]|nr:DUF222 domain-containing protein [Acidimicrobiia bacterium]NNL71098.1 DUF222 domain-containing protein [Acidimicrobiia bacterium]
MLDTLADPLSMLPTWELIDEIKSEEREVSRHRARQVELLRELERRTMRDPSPTTLAADLDVSTRTASELLETARRTPELSDRFQKLQSGAFTFDRAAALARLFAAGAEDETLAEAESHDIAGIYKLRSLTKRVRRRDERKAHAERHVRTWTNLDETAGFLSAQLTSIDWATVTAALDHRADRLPGYETSTREQLRADALVSIAQDALDGALQPGTSTGTVVTVMVDAAEASHTDCETGASVTAGPRIGPDTLDRLLCGGSAELVVAPETGYPIAVGPTTRVVPPKVRRVVLNRDGGCTIDGCTSNYRLEVHHILPRSRGGGHDLSNLTTLCWWHHHVDVHGRGNAIDPDSPPHRRTIVPESHLPP